MEVSEFDTGERADQRGVATGTEGVTIRSDNGRSVRSVFDQDASVAGQCGQQSNSSVVTTPATPSRLR